MVVAESMGNESGGASRDTEGNRRLGPAAGGHLASHLGERHGFPLDKGSAIDLTRTVAERRSGPGGEVCGSALRRRVVPRGTRDEVSSVHVLFLELRELQRTP